MCLLHVGTCDFIIIFFFGLMIGNDVMCFIRCIGKDLDGVLRTGTSRRVLFERGEGGQGGSPKMSTQFYENV